MTQANKMLVPRPTRGGKEKPLQQPVLKLPEVCRNEKQ